MTLRALFLTCLQDILTHLISLAEAEDKGVRLRVCQLLQLIINNQANPTCYLSCPTIPHSNHTSLNSLVLCIP